MDTNILIRVHSCRFVVKDFGTERDSVVLADRFEIT